MCVRVCPNWIDVEYQIFAGACGTHVLTAHNESVGMSEWEGKRGRSVPANVNRYICIFK